MRRATGSLINPELSQQADGAITGGGGPVGLRLAGALGDPDVLTLSDGTASVTFGTPTQGLELPGSGDVTGAVAAQPVKASISGGTEVTYADAWPTTNLDFVSTVDALTQLIVLQAPPAGTGDVVYRFPLSLSGLAARQEADGGIDFVNGQGSVVFNLPAGTMETALSTRGADQRSPRRSATFSGRGGAGSMSLPRERGCAIPLGCIRSPSTPRGRRTTGAGAGRIRS